MELDTIEYLRKRKINAIIGVNRIELHMDHVQVAIHHPYVHAIIIAVKIVNIGRVVTKRLHPV